MLKNSYLKFKETEIGSIPEKWDVLPIYDLAQWINGLAFKNINFALSGKPVIKINELKYGITDQTQFTEDLFAENYHLKRHDLLFSWSGSPDTSIDAFWYDLPDGWLNQHIFKVKPKENVVVDFLYYTLKAYKQRFIEIARDKQTTGLGHVTLADIKRFFIALPSIAEQKQIAEILSSLDDKIELNRAINTNLEKLASALFKKWFVDIGDELPEGWLSVTLGSYIKFEKGKKPNGASEEKRESFIPQILIETFDTGKSLFADPKGCVIAEKRDLLMVMDGASSGRIEFGHYGIIGSTLAKICPSGPVTNEFLYFYLKNKERDIKESTTGTSIPHADKEKIKSYEIILPTQEQIEHFSNITKEIIEEILTMREEITSLLKIRDSILPRLMSGKIRV